MVPSGTFRKFPDMPVQHQSFAHINSWFLCYYLQSCAVLEGAPDRAEGWCWASRSPWHRAQAIFAPLGVLAASEAQAENVWAAECEAEAQGNTFMAGRYDKWNPLHLRCKWTWAVQGVTGLGRHYTACSVIIWHSTADGNKLKSSEEVQFV